MPLVATQLIFEPLRNSAVARFLFSHATKKTWRLCFAIAAGLLFLVDHARGFTLADRQGLFDPIGKKLQTADVLTIMQVVWFMFSTTVLGCALVGAWRYKGGIAAKLRFCRV